jgi:hypothetical protein
VVLGVDGIADFNALHSRKRNAEVQLYAFDLLALDGEDLRNLPLHMRNQAAALYSSVLRDAERAMVYGAYEIKVEQVQPGSWKAHIRRLDGQPISTAPYGPDEIPILSTNAFYSAEDALQAAKDLIDRGHMK